MDQREENIFHIFKLVLTATGSHKTLTRMKGLDFVFRGWSRTARALLKSVLLKVLKHLCRFSISHHLSKFFPFISQGTLQVLPRPPLEDVVLN